MYYWLRNNSVETSYSQVAKRPHGQSQTHRRTAELCGASGCKFVNRLMASFRIELMPAECTELPGITSDASLGAEVAACCGLRALTYLEMLESPA